MPPTTWRRTGASGPALVGGVRLSEEYALGALRDPHRLVGRESSGMPRG